MDHALGLARGAAGIEDVQRVLGVHHLGGAVDATARHQGIEIGLAFAEVLQRQFAPEHDDVLQAVAALHRFVGDALQVNPVAAAIAQRRR